MVALNTNITLLLCVLLTFGLAGCGGGGDSVPPTSPISTAISGGVVKGPLANAIVTVYAYDPTQIGFKGAVVDTATTDNSAAITGLALPEPLTPPYIMEFTSDAGTTDITTGLAPVIGTMRTVVTQTLLNKGEQIYATPLTTMAVDMAINNVINSNGDTGIQSDEFETALQEAATTVVSTVGFGMSGDIDIFDVPPLVDNTTVTQAELANVAAYRTAVESLTAIVFSMEDDANSGSVENMLAELTGDLSADGIVDGNVSSGSSTIYTADSLILFIQDPATLFIPNTSTLVSDVESILVSETSITGTTSDTTLLSNGSIDPVVQQADTSPDSDNDTILNAADNCPDDANSDQLNTDGLADGGDACDEDDDNDGLTDTEEVTLGTDPLLVDTDSDTVGDATDNCPFVINLDQLNTDGLADGGDACDEDDDNDSLTDTEEVTLGTNPLLIDTDSDTVGDATDNCPFVINLDQLNTDGLADGGDACDSDDDEDGTLDIVDAFPLNPAESVDSDNDTLGDNTDNCPLVANLDQTNTDSAADGGDACDSDDDNDGVADVSDAYPLDATLSVLDTEPPIIQLIGHADIKSFQGEFYEDPGVTVSDNLDTNIEIVVSGKVLNQISGDYIITYDATDLAGNEAAQVTRKVRVSPLSLNFSKFYGANGSVENIVAVKDGSGDYYVSGYFTIYNSVVVNGIVRVNNDGTIDTTFNAGDGFNGRVSSLIVSENNDIYAVGDFTSYNGVNVNRIARLKSNGDLDQSFSIGSGFNDAATEIGFSSDGSGNIYVVGNFTEYNGNTASRIVRLKSDGSIDAIFNFGTGFDREYPYRAGDLINLEIPTDGSGDIYVSGDFIQYNGYNAPQIIRINDDGTPDFGFITGTGFSPSINNQTIDITLANDGSGDIYVNGHFPRYNGLQQAHPFLLRLNNDGSLDADFYPSSAIRGRVLNVTLSNDGTGDIFANGIKLHNDGSQDRSFDSTGIVSPRVILPLNDNSGDILLGGNFQFYNTISANNIVRINANGSVDENFLTGSGFNGIEKIASTIDGSGDIYVAGSFTHYFSKPVNNLARLNHDGTLDADFNSGDGFNGSVLCLAQAIDGSDDIYVGGNFTNYDGAVTSHLVKLNKDGSIDANFDKGIGIGSTVFSIAPVADGSGDIYVGGHFILYNGQFSRKIIRLKSNGAIDATFSIGNGFDDVVTKITPTIDDSGDIYVGGNFTTYNGLYSPGIIRLNRDGTVDSEFIVGNGFVNASDVGGLWTVSTVTEAIDGTGDVYIGGHFSAYKGSTARRFVRLNRDGSLDTGFNFESELSISRVSSILPAKDGSGDIYIGGDLWKIYQALSYNVPTGLVRMDSSGTINRNFDIDSNFNFASSPYLTYGRISPVTDMLYYGESGIYIAGFNTRGRIPLNTLARITSWGEIN